MPHWAAAHLRHHVKMGVVIDQAVDCDVVTVPGLAKNAVGRHGRIVNVGQRLDVEIEEAPVAVQNCQSVL
eukprot:1255022-Pleurochrysis_carterae.AAC.1